jgi:hypothetical protein
VWGGAVYTCDVRLVNRTRSAWRPVEDLETRAFGRTCTISPQL